MEFLTVKNLCKVYGEGENQVTALDHVSLTVEKGEFVAIIGSSGSGKSTLLHSIAGVDMPTDGKIYRGDGPSLPSDNASGYGIGLALSKTIITGQGGTITAKNHPEGGAVFTIRFPK